MRADNLRFLSREQEFLTHEKENLNFVVWPQVRNLKCVRLYVFCVLDFITKCKIFILRINDIHEMLRNEAS